GRRREFARFSGFAGRDVPDPNALATFEASRPPAVGDDTLHRELLALRRTQIVPHLEGARATGARAIGPAAVSAQCRRGNGAELNFAANFAEGPSPFEARRQKPMYASCDGALANGKLAPHCTVAFMAGPS